MTEVVTKPNGQAGQGLVMTRLVTKATRLDFLMHVEFFITLKKNPILGCIEDASRKQNFQI
jgi:hypothetical protein